MKKMSQSEKQIFCTDATMCAILAKCNSQNKWELWGLSEVSETGEAKYEIRLFSDYEFDEVDAINTTSGRNQIKVLFQTNWYEIVFIEHKKAINMPIEPEWYCMGNFSVEPISKSFSLLKLSFTYEDENESIESLIARGAGKNQTVLIDQINITEWHTSETRFERLIDVIDYFLKNGISINAKNELGETALLAAAATDCNTAVVNLLLQHGANINDKDIFGCTALVKACETLNSDVVKLLLANGAEVDSDCFVSLFQRDIIDIEELQSIIDLSKILIDKNININTRNNEFEGNTYSSTALMYAASYKHDEDLGTSAKLLLEKQVELMGFLLDNGAEINAVNTQGKTPLMCAIEAKNEHIVAYLLERGADTNIKDNKGNTALTYAYINSVKVIGELRKKMNVEQTYQIDKDAIPNQESIVNLYQFIYNIIPYLANEVFTGNLGFEQVSDKNWIKRIVAQSYQISFNWDGFEVDNIQKTFFKNKPSVLMILFTFPETNEPALAKYALLTIDLENKSFANYNTLEITGIDNYMMIGGVGIISQTQIDDEFSDNLYAHLNYGPVQYEANPKIFLRDMFTRLSNDNEQLSFLKHIKDEI
ncbi:MAG: hypothetical protein GX273_01135 [Bacteroidales bacterium]|nr:hypothetical protein [Bacteroidales bacterium]